MIQRKGIWIPQNTDIQEYKFINNIDLLPKLEKHVKEAKKNLEKLKLSLIDNIFSQSPLKYFINFISDTHEYKKKLKILAQLNKFLDEQIEFDFYNDNDINIIILRNYIISFLKILFYNYKELVENEYILLNRKKYEEIRNKFFNFNKEEFQRNIKKIYDNKKKDFTSLRDKKNYSKYLFLENEKPTIYDESTHSNKSFLNKENIEIIKNFTLNNKAILNIPDYSNINTIEKYLNLYKQMICCCRAIPSFINKENDSIIKILNFQYNLFKISNEYRNCIISNEINNFIKEFQRLISSLKKRKVQFSFPDINKYEDEELITQDISVEFPNPITIYPKENKWKTKNNVNNNNNDNNDDDDEDRNEVLEKNDNENFFIRKKEKINNRNQDTFHPIKIKEKNENKIIGDFLIHPDDIDDKDLKMNDSKINEDDDNQIIYIQKGDKMEIKKDYLDYLEKFEKKDDEDLEKGIIKIMKSNSNNNLLFPKEFAEPLNEKDFYYSNNPEEKYKGHLLNSKTNPLTLKFFQKCVDSKCFLKNTGVIIALDCSGTINNYCRVSHLFLAFSIINVANLLEIEYSIVIFSDYKFQFELKKFNEPHNEEIYQKIYDAMTVKRYYTRIADVCAFISKTYECSLKENKAIIIISNGLDPKLKFPDKWINILKKKNEKFGFYFIISQNLNELEKQFVEDIWKKFKDETNVNMTICEPKDIFFSDIKITETFTEVLSFFKTDYIDDYKKYLPKFDEELIIKSEEIKKLIKLLKRKDNKDEKVLIFIQNDIHFPSNEQININDINVNSNFCIKNIKSIEDENLIVNYNESLSIILNNLLGINTQLMNIVFPPNKPTMYAPSSKGNRLYLLGLINFILTHGQDNKIWLEKKAGLKRDFRVSIIIDSSISCISYYNKLMSSHSLKTIFNLLHIISSLQIPYVDIIIAREREPIVLCSGQDSTNCLNINSPIYLGLITYFSENQYSCNLIDAIKTGIKLKMTSTAKTNYMFVLTDGIFPKEYQNKLKNLISYSEENDILTLGIGLGYYPSGISKIFSKCFWSPKPSKIQVALSAFFGNEFENTKFIENLHFKTTIDINDFTKVSEIKYKSLVRKLRKAELYLETLEEVVNPDIVDENMKLNPKINKDNTMCKEGYFKGLKVLICAFWSKSIAGKEESDWVDYKYLTTRFDGSKPCLKEAFDYYGIEIEIVLDYENSIKKIQTGQYYAVWVISGDGSGNLPEGGNPNLVGQFINCLIQYWKCGGAVVLWCDNDPLFYETNLFLEKIDFPEKTKLRFQGNHKGKKYMLQGNINKKFIGVFNNKRNYSDNEKRFSRYSLAHNLAIIAEGTTVSYTKEINLEPFTAFAYDNEGGISIVFWTSNDSKKNGDIIIDGGFTKLFNELDTEGTYRYIQNIIAWTTQYSKRIYELGDNWIGKFIISSFYFEINYAEIWEGFTYRMSNDFDIVYMIDSTGSMSGSITAAKNKALEISNFLKKKFPKLNFSFGGIFYRDPIDSPSDEHQSFLLTNNIPSLQSYIGTINATGGGDLPEDWVGAYKLALEMNWREGTKLIIHIADAPAHGFYSGDEHMNEKDKLFPLIMECIKRNIKIIGFNIGSESLNCFQQCKNYYESNKGLLYLIYQFEVSSALQIAENFKDLVIKAVTCAAPIGV